MKTTTNREDTMTAETAKQKIAENIAGRIAKGATYEQATKAAFDYFNRNWPIVLAAVLADA